MADNIYGDLVLRSWRGNCPEVDYFKLEGRKAGCDSWQYGVLHNSGYKGIYNGLDEKGIHALNKKLTKNQKILDHMNAAEGAANVFRVTQARLPCKPKSQTLPKKLLRSPMMPGDEKDWRCDAGGYASG